MLQYRLRIDIVFLLLVLNEPAFLAEFGKLLDCGSINPLVVLIGSRLEIDLGFDDVV